MLTFLPGPARGALSLCLVGLNTIVWTPPLLLFHLLKLAVPADGWRGVWSRLQNGIGTLWISVNNGILRLANPVEWDIHYPEGLTPDRWYLVMANHRSWVDILVLQKVFNGEIPFLKFFLKKELFRVPFLGLAWWALEFPFLARSATASKDLETIREAAAKFKIVPVSVMNFVEGTRFSPEKRERQGSHFTHLLKPKAGGLAFILSSMRAELHSILDVTIAYPGGTPTMWDFLCGRAEEIRVRVREIPVAAELVGDFGTDRAYRRLFTGWLRELWAEKDRELDVLLGHDRAPRKRP